MNNIAVTGAKGRLGSELVHLGCTPVILDITKKEELEEEFSYLRPDVVINCAAYTDVDGAETKEGEKMAMKVNMWGLEYLMQSFDGRIIHISTDYVFDGKHGPYSERYSKYDPTLSRYGASKIGAEIAFLNPITTRRRDVLVRTTGLYGGCSGKHDFVKLVIDNLSDGKPLTVTKELKGNQTYVPHLANALLKLIELESCPKIVNLGSNDVVSRYEFALMIAKVCELDTELLSSCTNDEVPGWVAVRPKKGGLKMRLAKRLHLPIYSILDGLKELKEVTQC